MAIFGKSEKELKDWQQELDAREKSINEKQAELDRQQSDLTNRHTIAKEKNEKLAEKDKDICVREEEIIQRELEAKNGFVKEQRAAFKQAIDVQLKELEAREKELEAKQKEIESEFSVLKKLDGDLTNKDRSLKERELAAANGFADKNKIALREVEKREADCKALEERLQGRETDISARHQELENKAEELRKREVAISNAEQERDEGFSAERKKLYDDLAAMRSAAEKELSDKRIKELNSLEKLLSDEAAKRREALNKELSVERSQFEESLITGKSALATMKETLSSRSAELDELKDELEYQKRRLESKKDRLKERESNLNLEVETKVLERKQSFECEKSALNDELARLRESIKTSSILISNFEELKHKLGDEDPAAVLLKLKTYEEEIKNLREDLATRPTREMQEAFDRLSTERDTMEQERDRYRDDWEKLYRTRVKRVELESRLEISEQNNKALTTQRDNIEAHCNQLQADVVRLQTNYERAADREKRVGKIEIPYIQKVLPRATDKVDEIQWLERIDVSCIEHGLRFPRRILYAFHTALKTSELSPITVLSGVSGTGKSALPKLYSHFGGINFLNLSVQPNWDSQESMLGFFNSIDNEFDAQPVLRLLAQSQKDKSVDPHGLKDAMNLILLDEMNLAHIELYFAEFLSKLEERREMENELPFLDIKLGAGIEDYRLPIDRNVLWVGTMNQDETTKSLSDKVLDRGIMINFPRPVSLERRKQLKKLGDQHPLLSRGQWESWSCLESRFTEDQILPFKGLIEEMNSSLSKVGRALGHRVWQSIEYYMSNYPDVLEAQRNNDDTGLVKAMKVAFEDQLVQKVMPKLRGIETRGKSKSDCLDKIRTKLVNDDYTIIDDFDLACEFGYGQFIWNSANYLKDDESVDDQRSGPTLDVSSSSSELEEPHIDQTVSPDSIPDELRRLADEQSKKIWELTLMDIKGLLRCDAKDAKRFKQMCNQARDT